MYDDPIVAEIRRIRDAYAKRFNYDLAAICRDLREQQERSGRRVVKLEPKRPKTQPVNNATEQTDEPER